MLFRSSTSDSDSATPVVPGGDGPATPAGDGPAAPVGTGIVPAAAAPVVAVQDDEVPLAVMDVEDELQESDEQGLTPIEDEETPLANKDLVESVRHCILHFIELILAAIMGGTYIGSTRKQKKEIAALKKELEDKER